MQMQANEGAGLGWGVGVGASGGGVLLSPGTCAHDSSEDPALAVFDWLEPALEPLVQNGHAPAPVQGAGAAAVLALPLALNHSAVIVAVHLAEEGTGPPACRAPFSGPCRCNTISCLDHPFLLN